MKKRTKNLNRKKRLIVNLIRVIFIPILLGTVIYVCHDNSCSNLSDNTPIDKTENVEKYIDKIKSELLINNSIENIKNEKDEFENVDIVNDNRGVPILCYHSIGYDQTEKSPLIVSPNKLREHLKYLKDNGYTTLTISQLNEYLCKDKPIPVKSVVITFDDGYKDNYTNAYPILKEFNMNATIFVIGNYLNGETYMLPEQVKEISDYGIDIESHTFSHIRLGDLSYEEQLKELKDSKSAIENITGKEVTAIAYPEGIYNEDTKKAVEEAGYSLGFTIKRGYADREDNEYELNRICIDYTYHNNNISYVLTNLPK